MRLLLVRHGQSASNVDKSVNTRIADHAIPLTDEGRRQAREAGKFLAGYLTELTEGVGYTPASFFPGPPRPPRIMATGKVEGRLWVSPYKRTRETADEIETAIKEDCFGAVFESGRREDPVLAEQQFGLFDGLTDEELAIKYPNEHQYYKKCENNADRFWAQMPLGESRFDVTIRVHNIFGTFKRDEEKHNVKTLVVVCHGATIRAIVMRWLHLPFEWFEEEPNPANCSIRLIQDNADKGYIFKGFPKS